MIIQEHETDTTKSSTLPDYIIIYVQQSMNNTTTLILDQRWRLLLPERAQIVPNGTPEMRVHCGECDELVVAHYRWTDAVRSVTRWRFGQQQLNGRQHQAAVQLLCDIVAVDGQMRWMRCGWCWPCDHQRVTATIGEGWIPNRTSNGEQQASGMETGNSVKSLLVTKEVWVGGKIQS